MPGAPATPCTCLDSCTSRLETLCTCEDNDDMGTNKKESKELSADERLAILEKRLAILEDKQRDHDKNYPSVCPYKFKMS